jgi:alpha-tubulin suppressor-like RCC1 family protein
VKQISLGKDFGCALLNNGSVRCWGKNNYGQLGNGSEETESLTPVSVSGLTGADVGPKITQISSGHYHTCGVTADFKVYCWGSNFYGQFGSGSTGGIRVPRLVSPLAAVNQIFAGNEQTCFQMMDRSIQCSGFNHYGQLGPASLGGYFMAAQAVGGLTNIAVLSTYFNHTCAVTTDGTLKCLGGNSWGQLGDQSRTPSSVPVTAKIETKATKVAVSGVNTCYLDPTGKVYCFGSNGYGGLGTGDRTPVDGPVMVRIRR